MGKPVEQGLGEVDFCTAIYDYYADNADHVPLKDEPIVLVRWRGLRVHPPPAPIGPDPRDHALELPLLPGGPVRRSEPGRGQHDPPQARAAVPGVGGRACRTIYRDAGFPEGAYVNIYASNDQVADRRSPTRASRACR